MPGRPEQNGRREPRIVLLPTCQPAGSSRCPKAHSHGRACKPVWAHDRLRISSWCLTSTDSAITERAPPAPASRATVASRCRKRTARSRTAASRQDREILRNAHALAIRHHTTAVMTAARSPSMSGDNVTSLRDVLSLARQCCRSDAAWRVKCVATKLRTCSEWQHAIDHGSRGRDSHRHSR
jgi:hypothetical protein